MSKASGYFRTGKAILDQLAGEKPHSSITDWVEVLSSDRYDELSLDGIPELVDSINLQGQQGVTEASRAIRKKLKYGNVHRQLRALVILRALTENAGKGFQNNWANAQLLERLEAMAQDVSFDGTRADPTASRGRGRKERKEGGLARRWGEGAGLEACVIERYADALCSHWSTPRSRSALFSFSTRGLSTMR